MSRIVALTLALVIAGCQSDIATRFPPGLEPFDDDAEAAVLAHDGSESYVARGINTDMIRVYGRGFIHAPIDTVWASAQIPYALIALCNTNSQTVTYDNDTAYEFSFLVHYFVDDILNVEWDDQWRGDVIDVDDTGPTLVMLKHQKVFGSDFIDVSEGTLAVLATPDPSITELRFVEHLDAEGGSTADVARSLEHTYAGIRELSYGGTVPSCLR